MSKSLALQKSKSVQTRIEPYEVDGKKFMSIRDWVATKKSDGEYRPTPKGVVIPVEMWDDFRALVAKGHIFESKNKTISKVVKDKPSDVLYVPFKDGGDVPTDADRLKAFKRIVSSKLAVSTLDKLLPSKGMIVFKGKMDGKKVVKIKPYARAKKGSDGYKWSKL